MKKIISSLLAAVMVLSLAACSSKAQETTITKSAQGFGGEVSVSLTFKEDGTITAVAVEGKDETENFGGAALPTLAEQLKTAQSADIDGVSGATVTSNAVKTAAKAAIAEFKGEVAEVSFTPGTYEGSAYGNTSTITVKVTVNESAIEDIEIVSHNETPVLWDAARDTVIAEILGEQSLAVDTVAGASVSSNGIIRAVEDALASSGADLTALKISKTKEVAAPQEITKTADVIVVGGGGAGLVAALSAAEEGASVIVVEKAPFLGGNLVVFGGIYNTPDPDLQSKVEMSDAVKASLEAAISAEPVSEEHKAIMAEVKAEYEAWQKAGSKGLFDSAAWFALQTWNSGDKVANLSLVRQMTDGAYDGYLWLKDTLGVEFADKVTQGAGSLYQRTHGAIKPNGSGFINAYVENLEKYENVEIITKTAAEHFIMDGDKVVGVTATDTLGNKYTFNATKGVVLATGGFAGNVELRQKYCEGEKWTDLGPSVMTTNLKGITGDGIIMAEEIGAGFVDMDQIQLLHLGNPFTGSTKGVYPYKGRNSDEVIFVNQEGKRFVKEDGRRDVMCNATTQQTGGYYWMIHDASSVDVESVTVKEYLKGNYMYMADTLEELAEIIDVPADVLVKTVADYNSYVDNGEDPETGRTLLVAKIEQAPFFACKRVPAAHHTMGGVRIDSETHVLNAEGQVIEGLYAAGEVCGGIHGGNRVGGNAVDDTVVFGRIAGANAAK